MCSLHSYVIAVSQYLNVSMHFIVFITYIVCSAATNGVVLAAEKKLKSILYDESTISKIENASEHIGVTYSGMGPDFRVLVQRARRISESYYLQYKERMPISQLVQELAYVIQEYTQSGYVRTYYIWYASQ